MDDRRKRAAAACASRTCIVASSCALVVLVVRSRPTVVAAEAALQRDAVAGADVRTADRHWRRFHYCPLCGHALRTGAMDNLSMPVCTNPKCRYIAWEARTPRPCTTLFITRGHSPKEILMAIRARDPEKGALDFPGGFVQPGEHPVDSAKRELAEELGLTPQAIQHVGCKSGRSIRQICRP